LFGLSRFSDLPGLSGQRGSDANHSQFWQTLAPGSKSGKPGGRLAEALTRTFGGQEKFEEALRTTALGVFGSGWA
jgi:Fe-Mn family superoxide dismutase